MKVYVASWSGTSPVSRLIRWASGGPRSHSLVIYGDPEGGYRVVHSTMVRGVHEIPARAAYGLDRTVDAFEVTAFGASRMLQFVRDHVGVRYDWPSVLIFPAALFGNAIAGREVWRPRWSFPARYFCSEVISGALIHAGLEGKWDMADTPEQLAAACRESPAMRQVSNLDAWRERVAA